MVEAAVVPFRRPLVRRNVGVAAVVGVVATVAIVRIVANVWTDYLWFDDIGQADSWGRVISAKVTLGLGASVVAFVATSASILVAQRHAPNEMRVSERDPLLGARIFAATHPHAARNLLSGACALMIGPAAAGAWNEWLLYRHGSSGQRVGFSSFGKPIGFYLFELPFLSSLASWLFVLVVLASLVTLIVMSLMGSARFDPPLMLPPARRHLTFLFAGALFARGLGFWFSRYELTSSRHVHLDGMNYVDERVRAPGYLAMTIISIVGAVLVVALRRRLGWAVPVSIGAVWISLAVIVLGIVPAIWQRIALSDELARETSSIERTIAATRAAFDLHDVATQDLRASASATGSDAELLNDAEGLRNLRVWDVASDVSADAFNTLQKIHPNLQIVNVDADRAVTAGRLRPRLVAVREPEAIGSSWVAQRLTFTHGFGIVTATGRAGADGGPDFVARNLPATGEPKLVQPRVYFGERTDGYAITNTSTNEIDFGGEAAAIAPPYEGATGIRLRSFGRRVAFSIRFGDVNVLLSKSLTPQSKVLWTREVTSRVRRAAPFLRFDADPLPVVHRGRLLWVIEGYTTSASFPNSDRTMASKLAGSLQTGSVGYARNSVRAVVDAYSGETRFFRNENSDPIVAAYDGAFPRFFDSRTLDERYPGLRDQVRYPRDLFGLRAALWGRFHTDSASDVFTDSDRWVPSTSTVTVRSEPQRQPNPTTQAVAPVPTSRPAPVEYVVADPTASGTQEFFAQQALVTRGRNAGNERLRALVVARSDRRRYGRLTALRASSANLEGPASAAAQLSATPEISERETSLGRGGSTVISGEVQLVRVGEALLYLRPLYVQAEQARKPLLRYIEIRYRNRTGFAPTLAEALRQVSESSAFSLDGNASPSDAPAAPTDRSPRSVAQLLADADAAYRDAEQRLADGDLGGYQMKVDEMAELVARARVVAGSNVSARQTEAPVSGRDTSDVVESTTTVP